MKSVNRIIIRGYHIDHFGHVNHGRYVELLEEARWVYLDENRLIEVIHGTGCVHLVSRLEIDYKYPARAGDILRFETRVSGRSKSGFCMDQDVFIETSDRPVIQARIFNTFVDQDGKSSAVSKRLLNAWPDLSGAENRVSF